MISPFISLPLDVFNSSAKGKSGQGRCINGWGISAPDVQSDDRDSPTCSGGDGTEAMKSIRYGWDFSKTAFSGPQRNARYIRFGLFTRYLNFNFIGFLSDGGYSLCLPSVTYSYTHLYSIISVWTPPFLRSFSHLAIILLR